MHRAGIIRASTLNKVNTYINYLDILINTMQRPLRIVAQGPLSLLLPALYSFSRSLYPTPGSVSMYLGRAGSGSSFLRRLLMLTLSTCASGS